MIPFTDYQLGTLRGWFLLCITKPAQSISESKKLIYKFLRDDFLLSINVIETFILEGEKN